MTDRVYCERHKKWHDKSAPCPTCVLAPTVTQKTARMLRKGWDRMKRGGGNR